MTQTGKIIHINKVPHRVGECFMPMAGMHIYECENLISHNRLYVPFVTAKGTWDRKSCGASADTAMMVMCAKIRASRTK